jgi:rod shape-determining protein MreD
MNALLWPLALLACVALQWFFSLWTFLGVTPQLALVATVAAAVIRGPAAGETFGFCAGLLIDALGTHLFGANALTLALIGYSVGRLRRQMDASLPPPQMAVVALLSWVHAALLGVVSLVFIGKFSMRPVHALVVLPLYNAILAPFVFAWMQRFRVKEHPHQAYE